MSDVGDDSDDAISDSELARKLAEFLPGHQEPDPPSSVAPATASDIPGQAETAVRNGVAASVVAAEAPPAAGDTGPHGSGAVPSGQASSSDDEGGGIEFVDSVERCVEVCRKLHRHNMLAVDIEGIKLGRHGEICLVQMATQQGRVYLFDITVLGKSAFANGLQELLENDAITKLFFDCRGDVDALFHLYKVQPKHVLDMQVLCHKATGGDSLFVQGFAKAAAQVLPYHQRQQMKGIKDAGQALFAPERGGSLAVFKKRPMPKVLQQYCAQDVAHLFAMQKAWSAQMEEKTLRTVSELRMLKRIHSKQLESGPQMARRDFEIPGAGPPKKRTATSGTPSASPEKAKAPKAVAASSQAAAKPEAKAPAPAWLAGMPASDGSAAGLPASGLAPEASAAAAEPATKRPRTSLIQIPVIQSQVPEAA